MNDSTELPKIRLNAKEAAVVFGRSIRGDKWYLASLTAMYVKVGTPGRPRQLSEDDMTASSQRAGKISASAFARIAGVATKTVLKYLAAWDNAATTDALVPHSDQLGPFSDIEEIIQRLIETQSGQAKDISGVPSLESYFPRVEQPPVDEAPALEGESVSAGEAAAEAREAEQLQDEAAVAVDTEEFLREREGWSEDERRREALELAGPALANQDFSTPDILSAVAALDGGMTTIERAVERVAAGRTDFTEDDQDGAITALQELRLRVDRVILSVKGLAVDELYEVDETPALEGEFTAAQKAALAAEVETWPDYSAEGECDHEADNFEMTEDDMGRCLDCDASVLLGEREAAHRSARSQGDLALAEVIARPGGWPVPAEFRQRHEHDFGTYSGDCLCGEAPEDDDNEAYTPSGRMAWMIADDEHGAA